MRLGGLTPSRGYRLTITQVEGRRPVATVDCSRCIYLEPVDVPVDADTETLAEVILAAVARWSGHSCGTAYVGSNINQPYPQGGPDVSADLLRGSTDVQGF